MRTRVRRGRLPRRAELSQHDLWRSFFLNPDDPPERQVLRNLPGISTTDGLTRFEYSASLARQRQLEAGVVKVDRTFDLNHARAVHHQLFQDVYDWAGQVRPVNITKGGKPFAPVEQIDGWVDAARRVVTDNPPEALNRDEFVRLSASYYALLNTAHPFREGNGRTGKVLLDQLAEATPWAYDFDRVEKENWDHASQDSRPDDPRFSAPDPRQLVQVFDRITVDRADVTPRSEADQLRELHRTNYPSPTSEATRYTSHAQSQETEASRPGKAYERDDYGRGD